MTPTDSGSTTGTPSSAGSGTNTLSTLRTQCRQLLASSSDWNHTALDHFIADAIRFHSAQFPRRWRYSLSLTTGTQAYSLPGGHAIQGIRSVEYPSGEDPRVFLDPVEEWHDRFQDEEEVYALRGISDATTITTDTAAGTIVFAQTVATGETAIIEYLADHTIPTAGDDDAQITVPTSHWEALIAFVDFRAHWELEADKACTVSNVSIVLGQLGQEARYAWNRYKEIMNALVMQQSQSATIDWASQSDTMKRTY